MQPSVSIGRNYRLKLEKKLRKINRSRENPLSLKILDEHCHLIKPPVSRVTKNSKSKLKPDMKIKENKSSGVVPLAVSELNHT